MKKVLLIIITIFSIFYLTNISFWDLGIFNDKSKIIYCWDGECSLEEWTKIVKNWINDIETTRTTSEYIQDIVVYLLSFVTLIAVLYIIFAWAKILFSAWDDEEVSKSKKIIISVLIWIIVMWLAFAIVKFIIWVITAV